MIFQELRSQLSMLGMCKWCSSLCLRSQRVCASVIAYGITHMQLLSTVFWGSVASLWIGGVKFEMKTPSPAYCKYMSNIVKMMYAPMLQQHFQTWCPPGIYQETLTRCTYASAVFSECGCPRDLLCAAAAGYRHSYSCHRPCRRYDREHWMFVLPYSIAA